MLRMRKRRRSEKGEKERKVRSESCSFFALWVMVCNDGWFIPSMFMLMYECCRKLLDSCIKCCTDSTESMIHSFSLTAFLWIVNGSNQTTVAEQNGVEGSQEEGSAVPGQDIEGCSSFCYFPSSPGTNFIIVICSFDRLLQMMTICLKDVSTKMSERTSEHCRLQLEVEHGLFIVAASTGDRIIFHRNTFAQLHLSRSRNSNFPFASHFWTSTFCNPFNNPFKRSSPIHSFAKDNWMIQ